MMSIDNILPLATRGVLSLTGGGGKTSLMFHLARLLSDAGKTVLTTTTTKIFVPTVSQSETVLVDTDPQAILLQAASLPERGHITAAAARMDDTGKLKGFAPEAIRLFEDSGLFDWILVEADGSARRPLKAPAEHEPVIPPNTSILIAVAGLEVLGRPLTEEFVFRSELAGERMNLKAKELITEFALARLFAHPSGSFKGAPHQAARFIFLNQADDAKRCEAGARIAALLRQSPRPVAESLIVGQALKSIRIHACHSLRTAS
ncbi:MAG: putative selenium-dependent hydroxylase accessory protein YqeC [Deltaproteobacteria bacterium]|nr:putative selenium-dependent hydroxylase accessory protein YqeC [Deltaproteobacteria bacterium]